MLNCLCTLMLLCGCTKQTMRPKSVAGLTGAGPVPLVVELRLSEEYRQADWGKGLLAGMPRSHFGKHLVLNTEDCARAAFATVVVPGASPSAAQGSANAVLIPRLTEANVVIPGGGYSKVVTTMSLEWSLQDPSGKLIWVDTFKSESRGPAPPAKGRDQFERRFDAMFRDVFSASYRAMTSSPEIRKFAGQIISGSR
jgi:hypothetical protein